MTRAAIYARVSSAQQRDQQTIDSQLRTLPAFVAARGWRLVGTFVDDGRSASSKIERRTGLAALLAELAAGRVDVVVVSDFDRWTRSADLEERGRLLGAVQKSGAKLASASTGQVLDPHSSEGDFILSIQAVFAAEWVRKHREKTMRGAETAALRGRKPRGHTPFGYVYTPAKTFEVDPVTGPVVQEIFRRVAAGESSLIVGRDLDRRGIRTPTGRRWGSGMPRLIHRGPYRGEWLVDKKRGHKIAVPRLVEDDVWHAAQDALARNARSGLAKRTKRVYLCEGLLRCAVCGSRVGIQGEGAKTAGKRSRYYHCLGRRLPAGDRPRCTLPMVQVRFVDERVWAALAELLRRPDLAELLAERADGGDARAWERDAAEARDQLDALQRSEEALLERFTRGLISSGAMDGQLARIGDRRRWLEGQAERAAGAAGETRRRAAAAVDAAAVVEVLRARLDATTPEERRDLVRLLAPRMVLRADKRVEIEAILAPWSGAAFIGQNTEPAHGHEGFTFRMVA